MEKNKNMILRMVRYRKVLLKLKSLGMFNVFSNNLADALGVTPAVVRKDFSQMSMRGNKRGGYKIDTLIERMNQQLGKVERRNVVILGCGKLGQALMSYKEFPRDGIHIVAAFDNNSKKIDRNSEPPILPMEELKDFAKEYNIDVGIIAVPERAVHEVFEKILDARIRGIMNLSPVELKYRDPNSPETCIVRTVNIGLEIENLFCLIDVGLN